MPELSRFYGIIIRMFVEKGEKHHYPHIHAVYGAQKAVFHIETGQIMAGFFPAKERKFVEVWIEMRKTELRLNWASLNGASASFTKVEPLK